MTWTRSNRFDPLALPIADRHYNRRKVGSSQFVPPGRCFVLRCSAALWVTSWPFAAFVRHAWPGAWVNSLFRNESDDTSSELIRSAVALTRAHWDPPALGIVSFVNPRFVAPKKRRGRDLYGYCYLKAGWSHIGFTKGGLWVWQQLPDAMPGPDRSLAGQLFDTLGDVA